MSTRSFTSVTFLSCVSATISAVVASLATVNFGILSIWVNGSTGVLTLLYHLTTLILTWRKNRTTSIPSHNVKIKKLMLPDVKMPAVPSPAYSHLLMILKSLYQTGVSALKQSQFLGRPKDTSPSSRRSQPMHSTLSCRLSLYHSYHSRCYRTWDDCRAHE